MKRGFTLVELLAVITILGLLSLIVVPVVDKIIKDNKEALYQTQVQNIEQSAKNWASENIFSLPENIGDYIDKTICDLESDGLLEIDVKNPKTDEMFYKDSYVRITKTDYGFEYEYVDSGIWTTCDICVAVTNETKQGGGNIPVTGEYNFGDEYICNLGPDASAQNLTFYVLEDGDNTELTEEQGSAQKGEVSLIMKQNYDSLAYKWCDQDGPFPTDKKCNADGLITKLEDIASKWNRLQSNKISIPTYYQLVISDGKSIPSPTKKIELGSNWLLYFNSGKGYWTRTPNPNATSTGSAYNVWSDKWLAPRGVSVGAYGIRPVITISKNYISN